jgi:CheY-like chemotaxis protein
MPLASEAVSEKPGGEPRWVCLDPPPGDVITQSRALIVLPRLFPEMWEAGGPHVGPPDGGTAGFPSPDPAWDPDASLEREPTRRRTAEKAVLVADDDFDTREMLQAALQLWGYRALLAADGVAALAETRATSPDLILLDLLMPELDGWAVLANLRLDPRTRPIPVVVISAVSRRGLAEEVLAAGANAFVEKPFDIDVLETIIRRLLEQH